MSVAGSYTCSFRHLTTLGRVCVSRRSMAPIDKGVPVVPLSRSPPRLAAAQNAQCSQRPQAPFSINPARHGLCESMFIIVGLASVAQTAAAAAAVNRCSACASAPGRAREKRSCTKMPAQCARKRLICSIAHWCCDYKKACKKECQNVISPLVKTGGGQSEKVKVCLAVIASMCVLGLPG